MRMALGWSSPQYRPVASTSRKFCPTDNEEALDEGSLRPCAMLHATHNLFIEQIFDAMTAQQGTAPYVTTEFGCGVAITTAVAAIWVSRRNRHSP